MYHFKNNNAVQFMAAPFATRHSVPESADKAKMLHPLALPMAAVLWYPFSQKLKLKDMKNWKQKIVALFLTLLTSVVLANAQSPADFEHTIILLTDPDGDGEYETEINGVKHCNIGSIKATVNSIYPLTDPINWGDKCMQWILSNQSTGSVVYTSPCIPAAQHPFLINISEHGLLCHRV